MEILKMTLRKYWFDKIQYGEKTEEYREIKWFWISRFFDIKNNLGKEVDRNLIIEYFKGKSVVVDDYTITKRLYDYVEFYNGAYYSKDLPWFSKKMLGINCGLGRAEWGAPKDENVFIISLG